MRVLLRADVAGVGKKGDIVEVADGFGRNYLVPRGLALKATPGVEAQAESMRRSRDQKDAQDRSAAEDIAKVLVPLTITVPAKAGAEGKLFGSVTTAEIAQAVADQARVDLDRKTIEVPEAIKTTGEHMVSVKLHADVQFQFKLDVVPA
ncbi:MAG: 50S ribosomal protein L9 [Acidimicrobiales bacterium]|nr:50S ribosomal protein L9 [Acidimicrobiales bacterium]